MELGDNIAGEAFLELDGVDGAGCHRFFDFGDIAVRDVCDEFQVIGDEVVVQAHDLEVGVLGGLGDADVVVEALAHALYAVSAYEDRHEQALLWLLAYHGLELAPGGG